MSTFQVLIRQIDDVIDHPNADRLSICKILGYDAITAKNPDGTHRFQKGELIVYVPEAAVVPTNLLKQFGYWNEEKDMGMLSGRNGDRVKAVRLRGILSQGLVWKIHNDQGKTFVMIDGDEPVTQVVSLHDDVADFFNITKYEPPVPTALGGEVTAVYDFAFDFDVENAQNYPDFLRNDIVEVTEKLHGTCARIAFRPNVSNPELFGQGNVAIASKGLGHKGLMFKNNEKNRTNLYVKAFTELGVIDKIEILGRELNASVDLFGEIFGKGVQDLHYGADKPIFRAFDIAINGVFLPNHEKTAMFDRLGVERVPVLYSGVWDDDILKGLRDGRTTIGETNIREGIVVTAMGDQNKREYQGDRMRPFLKMVSPDYLTRKGEVTEFQ